MMKPKSKPVKRSKKEARKALRAAMSIQVEALRALRPPRSRLIPLLNATFDRLASLAQEGEARRVACPDCRAPIGEPCRRLTGKLEPGRRLRPHSSRRLLAKVRP